MVRLCGVGLALLATSACGASPPEATQPVTISEPQTSHAAQEPDVGVDEPEPRDDAPPAPSEGSEPQASAPPQEEAAPSDKPKETRTSEVIRGVVQQNRDSVRACFDALSRDEKGNGGVLTLSFTITPRGSVKSATLNRERSTIAQPKLVSCAIDAVKRMKFPPSSRGFESSVNYPFDFKN